MSQKCSWAQYWILQTVNIHCILTTHLSFLIACQSYFGEIPVSHLSAFLPVWGLYLLTTETKGISGEYKRLPLVDPFYHHPMWSKGNIWLKSQIDGFSVFQFESRDARTEKCKSTIPMVASFLCYWIPRPVSVPSLVSVLLSWLLFYMWPTWYLLVLVICCCMTNYTKCGGLKWQMFIFSCSFCGTWEWRSWVPVAQGFMSSPGSAGAGKSTTQLTHEAVSRPHRSCVQEGSPAAPHTCLYSQHGS